ncbi:inhibitor of nuclear factor kappa-B kinase-interacting protein-like isoform X2 [Acipenser ruthenus]|uniref:inhibitor of nuclear factor kappa-B kinase-interacting protein-like isoform X2 n=1 Tax=Acipenser ruthenus TaxID=7906 RepID=UPI0027425871|nr:inhibitor of nuclear factor kappa-B kinase-interacting protein-like isoform X2 [Acipenser ruthenus]
MPSNEVKQRKKTTPSGKQNEETEEKTKLKEEKVKQADLTGKTENRVSSSGVDIKTVTCLLSLIVSLALAWFVLQQAKKFADVEEKYNELYKKTRDIQSLENEINQVSKKFENTQALMIKLRDHPLPAHVENLEGDIEKLKKWSSNITEKRAELQENLTALSGAVGKIEQSTATIAKDMSMKVSAVKTDVRRISGLESDVLALADSTQVLEEKVKQAEKMMVQKIGDLLAGSINRMTELKSSTSRNANKIDSLKKKYAELKAEDGKLTDRLLSLESGRARLVRTVTFANDLKPKVFAIRKDFALLEPRVSDLTFRIGRLASDLLRKEQDIALLKDTFFNLTVVKTDLQNVKQQLTEMPEVSDIHSQTSLPSE